MVATRWSPRDIASFCYEEIGKISLKLTVHELFRGSYGLLPMNIVHNTLMTPRHKWVLGLSWTVVLGGLALFVYYYREIFDWLSHNLWVVVVPFGKGILKKALALKFYALIKSVSVLVWHLSKLLILKLLKTLGLRYGVFFSQSRWYWIRRCKVLFLRKGKQFFRQLMRFWSAYDTRQKGVILLAFFPVGLVFFFLGLSFNVTRKTMVQKTQETAIFKMATSAGNTNKGIRAWIRRLDQKTLQKIQTIGKGSGQPAKSKDSTDQGNA